MKSINKVFLMGFVGKEPEVRHTQAGQKVASFTMATNEYWRGPDGKANSKTEWHKIVAWGKLASSVENNVAKGSYLYIEGKMQTRQWENREGKKQYTTEILAREIGYLDRKEAGEEEGGIEKEDETPQQEPESNVPF